MSSVLFAWTLKGAAGSFCNSSVVGDYVSWVSGLAMQILGILTSALGARDPHFLNQVFVPESSTVRFNYYLPCPQPQATYGSSPLTDIQALAILHPDDVGGIEVHKEGKWVPVPSRPGSLLVNIGDVLQVCAPILPYAFRCMEFLFFVCLAKHMVMSSLSSLLCTELSAVYLCHYMKFNQSNVKNNSSHCNTSKISLIRVNLV